MSVLRFVLLICVLSGTVLNAAAKKSNALAPLASSAFNPDEMPRSGFYSGMFQDPETGRDLIKYCIKTPDTLPNKRHLILIADFHGCGGNEEGFKWVKTAYPEIDDQNIMWVGMKSQGRCWADTDHERISKCLEWVIRTYPVDQRRIFFRGYSSGAFLQRRFGSARQNMVAGIIQYAGGGPVAKYSKDPENLATEFYIACGEQDKFHGSACLPEVKSLQSQKYRFIFRSWNQHNHTSFFDQNDPQVSSVSKDIMLWLYALRHKTRGLYREDIAFLKALKKKDDVDLWSNKEIVDELVRIGGNEAGIFVLDALKSKNEDVVLKAIESCMRVNYSNAVTMSLGKVYFKHKSATIRSAAGRALNRLAFWRHNPAQQALAAKVMDKKSSEDDKVNAIEGIKRCIDFQNYGSFRNDFELYKSLIYALNDESEKARSAAFAVLKTCNKQDYGYSVQLEKRDRKKPVRAWQAWFANFMKEHS